MTKIQHFLAALCAVFAASQAHAGAAVEPGQNPYQSRAGASCSLSYSLKTCTVHFAAVPSGQRLVTTGASCNIVNWPGYGFGPGGSYLYESTTSTPGIDPPNVALPAPYIPSSAGPFTISAAVQVYFNSLDTPNLEVDVTPSSTSSAGSINLYCQLTGYLVTP